MADSRNLSLQILRSVLVDGQSLMYAFDSLSLSTKDVAFTKALCFGVLRWHHLLEFWLSHLLQKPIKEKEFDVQLLLEMGIYQLWAMDVPDYAVIDESVKLTRMLNKHWASGLVNAVLRNFVRQEEELVAEAEKISLIKLAHPEWLWDKISQDYPEQATAIMTIHQQSPNLCLRLNLMKTTREKYLELLREPKIDFIAEEQLPKLPESAVILEQMVPITSLPGFAEGWVSIQDAHAQFAASLLQIAPQQKILDACAAPGGKACHLLESSAAEIALTVMDIDKHRLDRVRENLTRLNLSANIVCSNAENANEIFAPEYFDRILLDVPCSGSGVVRRHPDIKFLRKPADIKKFSLQQKQLLASLWPLLASDGLLLYVTCSIFPEENSEVIQDFLATQTDAAEVLFDLPIGQRISYGWQLFPSESGDGFFYSLLRKA